jgi:predicted dehydrogenase
LADDVDLARLVGAEGGGIVETGVDDLDLARAVGGGGSEGAGAVVGEEVGTVEGGEPGSAVDETPRDRTAFVMGVGGDGTGHASAAAAVALEAFVALEEVPSRSCRRR